MLGMCCSCPHGPRRLCRAGAGAAEVPWGREMALQEPMGFS